MKIFRRFKKNRHDVIIYKWHDGKLKIFKLFFSDLATAVEAAKKEMLGALVHCVKVFNKHGECVHQFHYETPDHENYA
jgi:hypothetical protein